MKQAFKSSTLIKQSGRIIFLRKHINKFTQMKCIAVIILLFVSMLVQAQIPNGAWRDHIPLRLGKGMAVTPNKVFCYMNSGGMLSYDLTTAEVSKWTTISGLSEINISALAYNTSTNLLIVGYESGNIDVVKENEIINLNEVFNKSGYTEKSINNIFIYNEYAYLSCDFGVVVLNTEKLEFKDSYIFGASGAPIKTNDVTIHNGVIYAATDKGLFRADVDAPNLVDYNYWDIDESILNATNIFESVESFNGHLIVVYKNAPGSWDVVNIKKSGTTNFSFWGESYSYRVNKVSSNENYITFSSFGKFTVFDKNLNLIHSTEEGGVQECTIVNDNIFTAGKEVGFSKRTFSNAIDTLKVNAPMYPYSGRVIQNDEDIWVTTGGEVYSYTIGGIYRFRDNKWKSYNRYTLPSGAMSAVGNTSHLAVDPRNPDHLFVGTWRFGIYEFENNHVVDSFTQENPGIFESLSTDNGKIRTAGISYDSKNNLWVIADNNPNPVFMCNADGEWERKEYNIQRFATANFYRDFLITSNDQLWLLSDSDGIVVVKEEKDGTVMHRSFSLISQEGESYSRGYCLAEDKDGNVWVGTSSGPLEYTNIRNIFEASTVTGYHVKIPRYDGTPYADLLLKGELINDIYIDGGNRKWFATSKSGAFLISEDGKKTVHNFRTENSPIYSNDIMDIGVHEKTGEVFFSTRKGLISFMGQATRGNQTFTDVYVYPNPVRPGYEGDITISGLIAESIVKITDVSGNLVWETTSLGGQAIWNGKNFNGRRVATGVYLVMLSNADGSESHITKLLFLH